MVSLWLTPHFIPAGGDVISGNGLGSISKFGESFPDENFKAKHGAAGFLSMANSGEFVLFLEFNIEAKLTDDCFAKLTQAKIQMDLNFSLRWFPLHGWTENMLSLER